MILARVLLVVFAWTGTAQRADLLQQMGVAPIATLERGIMVPMRDGVRLWTSVIRPANVSGPVPAVFIRTPYEPDDELLGGSKRLYARFVAEGYAIVVQNERGTRWSEGTHQLLAGARNDGYDALTWIASQPWSNGKAGTIGCSSSAEHQLGLAAMNHPAHKAMIPMSAGAGIGDVPGVSSQGLFFKGGVPEIGPWSGWYYDYGHIHRPKLPAELSQDERVRLADFYLAYPRKPPERSGLPALADALTHLPSQEILRSIGTPETDLDRLVTLSPTDPHWRTIDFIRNSDRPKVPALHVNAWYDVGAFETVKLFEYLGDTPNQFLIMAPTRHCGMLDATGKTMAGEREVGDARFDYEGLFLKWFDYWLKDKVSDVLQRPKVQAYLMGANVWKTYPAWPVPNTTFTRFYLRSDGRANGRLGTGLLTETPPRGEPADSLTSDPMNPVPSQGAGCCSSDVARDQAGLELRKDVLVYSTDALKRGLEVTGEIKAVLYVSSSALDTDVALKVVDVYPDGKAYNLYDTMLRLRYRDGFDRPAPLTPGAVYRVELAGLVTSNFFAPGHRLRIEIAGSNFPNFERNLQTGGRNFDETKPVAAENRIYHDGEHQSYIEVPVVTP